MQRPASGRAGSGSAPRRDARSGGRVSRPDRGDRPPAPSAHARSDVRLCGRPYRRPGARSGSGPESKPLPKTLTESAEGGFDLCDRGALVLADAFAAQAQEALLAGFGDLVCEADDESLVLVDLLIGCLRPEELHRFADVLEGVLLE